MTRLEIQQANEPVTTFITVLSNGGLAMLGAFAAVIYHGDGTDGALAMAIVSLFLISGSFVTSVFLREEV